MINNIIEDYCSFEVSKLLKEKGFDIFTWGKWVDGKLTTAMRTSQEGLNRPTHSLGIKWIRENFGIHIKIDWFTKDDNSVDWDFSVQKIGTDIDEQGNSQYLRDYDIKTGYNSYEECESMALLYTLQNLIS